MRIKPTHESQGPFVVINDDDFNPDIHTKIGAEPESTRPRRKKASKEE